MIERLITSRWIQTGFLLLLLCGAVLFNFSDARWREQIRNFTFDQYNILSPRVASDALRIVDIDEASLKEIGQMPWPRTVMAALVEKLNAYGAKLIIFDIVFAEPDRTSPSILQQNPALADHDKIFGAAIKQAGNVITGFSLTNEPTKSSPRQKGIFRGKNLERFVPTLRGASVNLRPISKHAAGNGSFFVSTDTDGLIRRVPMLVAYHREGSKISSIYPSLSLETLRLLSGERGGHVKLANEAYANLDPARFGIEGIRVGKKQMQQFVPTNARGEFLVHYAPSNAQWYLPAHKVLDQSLDPAELKDKIVFIGTSAVGLKDIRSTPLNTFIPGVEVHLNIVDQILQGHFLKRPIEAQGGEALAIFAAGLLIILAAPFIGGVWLALIVTTLITGGLYGGWLGFTQHGLLLDVLYPALCLLMLFSLAALFNYMRTEREKREVRQAFGLYISPDFMEELTKNPEKLKLGGDIRDLTVMFTDIRRFTSISEHLSPEALIQLMNDFLTPMSAQVMGNRGTIDKYMGDAMMAFWNAPLDDEHHARHACEAALGMRDALAPINETVTAEAKAQGREPILLQAGIGINTGPCAVGNMGSRQRFAYSALGDAVNLASRLEGQTKNYGVDILMGEDTATAAPEFALLELDLIRVIGKTEAVRIFALLGNEEFAQQEQFQKLKTQHDKMLQLYRSADFEKALKELKSTRKLAAENLQAFYDLYEERIKALIKTPPPQNWDGVFEAQSK